MNDCAPAEIGTGKVQHLGDGHGRLAISGEPPPAI